MIRARGVLFDIDGTLVQSLAAVERAWVTFAARHGISSEGLMDRIHGRRSIDSIRLILPHLDAAAEDIVLRGLEASDTTGVVATAGALELIAAIGSVKWGIVTSGTSDVATARLRAAGISGEHAVVFGEEVVHGKPNPEPFLLGATRLGLDPSECVAFEDTAAGIRSAKSAGMQVIGIGTGAEVIEADLSVADFRALEARTDDGYFEVSIRN